MTNQEPNTDPPQQTQPPASPPNTQPQQQAQNQNRPPINITHDNTPVLDAVNSLPEKLGDVVKELVQSMRPPEPPQHSGQQPGQVQQHQQQPPGQQQQPETGGQQQPPQTPQQPTPQQPVRPQMSKVAAWFFGAKR